MKVVRIVNPNPRPFYFGICFKERTVDSSRDGKVRDGCEGETDGQENRDFAPGAFTKLGRRSLSNLSEFDSSDYLL
jgi:hypothetical protein